MKKKFPNISLRAILLVTLLAVSVVPLLITGWMLSDRSSKELRAAEGRYQTQLVEDKAQQIEMFGKNYSDLVRGYAKSFEFAGSKAARLSDRTQSQLGQSLNDDPGLLALSVHPLQGNSL